MIFFFRYKVKPGFWDYREKKNWWIRVVVQKNCEIISGRQSKQWRRFLRGLERDTMLVTTSRTTVLNVYINRLHPQTSKLAVWVWDCWSMVWNRIVGTVRRRKKHFEERACRARSIETDRQAHGYIYKQYILQRYKREVCDAAGNTGSVCSHGCQQQRAYTPSHARIYCIIMC